MISKALVILGGLGVLVGIFSFTQLPGPLNLYALVSSLVSFVFMYAFAEIIDLLTEIRDGLVKEEGKDS